MILNSDYFSSDQELCLARKKAGGRENSQVSAGALLVNALTEKQPHGGLPELQTKLGKCRCFPILDIIDKMGHKGGNQYEDLKCKSPRLWLMSLINKRSRGNGDRGDEILRRFKAGHKVICNYLSSFY